MKLMAVLLDTTRTHVAVVFENEHIPYGRRLVEVELTQEQIDKLRPLVVGQLNGKVSYEELGSHWLEGFENLEPSNKENRSG